MIERMGTIEAITTVVAPGNIRINGTRVGMETVLYGPTFRLRPGRQCRSR